jgi:small subunit ribosomal protein S3
MGKKVHPFVFRIGETTNWRSRWFSQKKYKDLLREDYFLRKFVVGKLAKAGLSHVEIEKSSGEIKILIFTSRPGLVIGRGGAGIDALKDQIEKYYLTIRSDKSTKIQIKLQIEEVLKPDSNSQILGQQIADQIEKRMPFRRVLKQAIMKAMQSPEVEGVKVMLSGRLDGAEMARTEWLSKGKIPLQTIRANIDYAQVNSYCRYGVTGIKVWIYKGEVFQDKS